MINASQFIRFFRKKLVLGLIFSASLIYCVTTVLRDSPGVGQGADGSEMGSISLPANSFRWTTNTTSLTCRNSLQGPQWVADDRGYVCNRTLLLSSGCCDADQGLERYPCDSCADGCCSSYEFCISCCLRPQQRPTLERVLGRLGRSPKSLKLYALVQTQFDLCLTKCRTSSQSVRNENTYIDPVKKHCFGENS
ncbi:UPF0454 protein C12orf49 homolog [Galendromus occidentalis]|uniref:SREBP regulating gene protein n=1 Tax=Galendromus occidentalis TaxID=34638 RepID=A0AAJ6VWY6_9ACAR|nr:UPF0454 protein C12orf49 homolog [Galendromus occidentalis]